jgi:hypothetical protein
VVLTLLTLAPVAAAQEPAPARSSTDANQQATNPVPTIAQLSFEPAYTFANGTTRYTAQLIFQAVLPYQGLLIPGLKVEGFRSVARVVLSGGSTEVLTGTGPVTGSGLSDLFFVDGVVHSIGPIELGAGFGSVLPMATHPLLGQGKLQVGPAVLLAALRIPHLQLAALAQGLWSVAGDSTRPALASVSVQPLIAVLLPADCSLFSNTPIAWYWKGPGTTVPVSLGFSHAFSTLFVGQLQGVYTVAGAGKGAAQLIVLLNFQP